jgi:hypothetical protein
MGPVSLFYNVIQFIKNMKKIWFIFIVPCFVAIGFSSCSDDTTWRDDNLAFIDKIKTRDGIYAVGDSINGYPGLYYEVLHDGLGDSIPKIGYKVQVSYKVWLYNDTITYDKNHTLLSKEAFSYNDKYDCTVGGSIIEGWTLALQHMAVGDKWRLYIPYYLGYGSSATTNVPAYSTLIYDIYLRKVVSEN